MTQRQAELIARLERRIASLERDSSNSSKPPSSDPPSAAKPKPVPKPRKKKRRRGHKRRQRVLLPADRLDLIRVHEDAGVNPDRWERVLADDGQPFFRVLQQVEFDPDRRRFTFTEHRFAVHRHRKSGRMRTAARPVDLRGTGGQLFGPGMRAYTATQKLTMHASFSAIQGGLRETLGLRVSVGYLAKVVAQAAEALEPTYERIAAVVRSQGIVYIDETGDRENGSRSQSWLTTCPVATLFRVGVSRATVELEALLGPSFTGVIASDFYAAYRKLAREKQDVASAFCRAHLIREVKAVAELREKGAAIWSRAMRASIGALFRGWHQRSERLCRRARYEILQKCEAWMPWVNPEVATLQKRLREHAGAYFRLIDTPGNLRDRRIEPTNNNAAERALRGLVLHRRVTQGTRGEAGCRWWERGWSTLATLRQHGTSFFAFLRETPYAAGRGLTPPVSMAAA